MLIIVQEHSATASGTSWWTVLATLAAVVAALAALVTVVIAARTVRDGREAHSEEMDQRSHALVADIRVQRHVHASRLADVLIAIARAANEEMPAGHASAVASHRLSFIPSLQAQLRTELAAFRALDIPDFPRSDELAEKPYGDLEDRTYQTATPDAIRKLAGQGFAELQGKLATDYFRLKLDANRRLADLPAPTDKRTWRRGCARCIPWPFRRGAQ
jgi:hypothetical protein